MISSVSHNSDGDDPDARDPATGVVAPPTNFERLQAHLKTGSLAERLLAAQVAAAQATLRTLADEGFGARVERVGAYLRARLTELPHVVEVRGLGLLNIRTVFGETAARRKMKLKLIVHLHKTVAGEEFQRLPLDSQSQEILGIPIRKVVLHVAAGRNLAVLLEAAVRNCILQMRGIDSMSEFINRQQQAVLDDNI